ncbi:patatin-like phospholipase family protein [Winogradskyella forsetii]|uniref:patatin-like phospholipase family protein n=1 Tax=Winogradskyella forsetii TaxID=2686077 RepID=UPI0015B81BBA|nr:patatin-like phospholipase family protein [Winogradskyella forsetii]
MNRLGIALSGGGARGAAHIGVLQALNENEIFPNRISGSSAGSIIGALYCAGYTPTEILKLSHEKLFLKIFKIGFLNKGLTELTYLKDFLKSHLDQDAFESLDLPLHVCISNINSGKFEIISEGRLIEVLAASCALPLLFKSVKINGYTYVDGGLLNNLPVEPLLLNCEKIIGISVCPHETRNDIRGIKNLAERCLQLAIWGTMQHRFNQCNIALEIEKSFQYGMFDAKKSEELFKIGYEATMQQMDEIKQKLKH